MQLCCEHHLRMDVCVQLLSCKTGRATLVALMLPTLPEKVGDRGAMLSRRCGMLYVQGSHIHVCFVCCSLHKLFDNSAARASWGYCAPVVDYDALRKDMVNIFANRASEVQQLVTKLQKTQRAAEQALERFIIVREGAHRHALALLLRYAMTCGA